MASINGLALRNISEFYINQLREAYYRKRGKALAIPNIIYCLDRLIQENKPIKIIDIGCGEGNLLNLIGQLLSNQENKKQVELVGLDFDIRLLERAKNRYFNNSVRYLHLDLRANLLKDYYGKYDIVICINVLHEIYTSFLGNNGIYSPKKISEAKKKISHVLSSITKLLSESGSLILYDGLYDNNYHPEQLVRFKLKNPKLEASLPKFSQSFPLWRINFLKDGDNIYQMKYHDFYKFLTTFKYFDTNLWDIEIKESYQYFKLNEFEKVFKRSNLQIENITLVNNDLSLWQKNIELIGNRKYPIKAVLFVTSAIGAKPYKHVIINK